MINKYIQLLITPLIITHASSAWNTFPKKELEGAQYALGIDYATFFKTQRLHRQIKKNNVANKFNKKHDLYIDGNLSSLSRSQKNLIMPSQILNKTDRQYLIETPTSAPKNQSTQVELTPEKIKVLEQQIVEMHAMAHESLVVDQEVIDQYKAAQVVLQEKNTVYIGIIKSQQHELNWYKNLFYLSVVTGLGMTALTTFIAFRAREQNLLASEAVKGWIEAININKTLIATLESTKLGK
ncbi:MAG: hypothetical protein BWY54_00468 [Candidatus Dependentiae bacterium ADurb.Bin331]|nr:MAG: hypothetical protein BWY54_00468 [Candidatus Dependentiae bacterium ADurb.Bin331]